MGKYSCEPNTHVVLPLPQPSDLSPTLWENWYLPKASCLSWSQRSVLFKMMVFGEQFFEELCGRMTRGEAIKSGAP